MIRLDKLLAHLGYGTRSEVKKLIRKGTIYVNNEIVKDDDFKVDETLDEVVVDGFVLDYQKYLYYMLNKPSGYVSATYDPKEETVLDIINDPMPGLFPVGRLDKDTEGLLIITNDGKLAHNLLSPKKHVEKVYYVEYEGERLIDSEERFQKGIELEDGYVCMSAKVEFFDDHKAYVKIKEGKYHQVKRMFKMINLEVTYLKRIKFGPLDLDPDLEIGEFRLLSEEEIEILKNN